MLIFMRGVLICYMKYKKVISYIMVFFLLVGFFTPLNGIFDKDNVPIEAEAASYDGWGDTSNGAYKNKKCPHTGKSIWKMDDSEECAGNEDCMRIGHAICFSCTNELKEDGPISDGRFFFMFQKFFIFFSFPLVLEPSSDN